MRLLQAFQNALFISPPIGEWSIMMTVSVWVSLCVCLSVRDHSFGPTRAIFTNCSCMLPMAVARSSSGGVVICYVLPVLCMTSYLLMKQGRSTSLPS